MTKTVRGILGYTTIIFIVSVSYFFYVYDAYPLVPERETFLSEIGEACGEIGLWALLFIYGRTILKLIMGKGALAKRILPDYSPPVTASIFERFLGLLNRTHIYVGITTIAIILIHIFLMGMPMDILFFPAVLALVIWQGLFGIFLSWRYSPAKLRKLSYLVHAQFITGITIGIFAFLGHLLIDD
ncbi:MAG: hypothetical protein GXP13_03115 [Gammaproteobacteria bacterium]|nr:hypothetical protein [Gammaproteobacteria bacterium]